MGNDQTKSAAAGIAAVGSVMAASSCCLPVLPFAFAAGAAGTSAFLAGLRPYFLALSLLLIGYGFYQAWRARQCRARPSIISAILLWGSALFVAIAILFPQALANTAANLLAR